MTQITLHPVILAVPETALELTRREKVAFLRDHARQALAQSARFSGVVLGELEKSDLGAPLPSNGIHWSISHKDKYVAGVTAPHPVGIDIERIQPVKAALKQRIADADEWALASDKGPRLFFRFWTAKEAVLKAVGTGFTALAQCRITALTDDAHMQLAVNGSPWTVTHYWVNEDHLATVTTQGSEIVWHRTEDSPAGLQKKRKYIIT